jgi:hypothetical protein
MRIALLLFALTVPALAQPSTCVGLISVTEAAPPVYPPIARAAHVMGNVIFLVSFKTTGDIDKINVVSGPPMLVPVATDYVRGFHANEYDGQRACQIELQYELTEGKCDDSGLDTKKISTKKTDVQHIIIETQATMICDPAATLKKHKKFLWFF